MENSKYQKQLVSNVECTKRVMEETKGIGQKYIKGDTKDCFLFGSWLSLKKLEESAMEVGANLIGMVKKNTKGFCKETIKNLTEDWPGGS